MERMTVNRYRKKIKLVLKSNVIIIHKNVSDTEFVEQVFRKDILRNMLANTKLTGKELFDLIIKENKESCSESRQGLIFETLCQILIILKCVENINYTEICYG